jgi:hypothetical protein
MVAIPLASAVPVDAALIWEAFAQHYGVPDPSVDALIIKSSGGHGVDVMSPPTQVAVSIASADTISLLRNYYHELRQIAVDGAISTLISGMMTVTGTEIR